MAIQWGAFNGHLRVGIEVSTDPVGSTTTSVTVYVDTYVQVDSDFSFNDAQTVTVTGSAGATYNFQNNLGANQSAFLGTIRIYNQNLSYGGGPTYSFHGALSGAFNGAAPFTDASFTLPPRVSSTPNAPTLNSPSASVVLDGSAVGTTFTWTSNDPGGFAQNAYALRITRPDASIHYWNEGTQSFQPTQVWNTTGSQSVTVPAGKIASANGVFYWSVQTQSPSLNGGPFAADRVIYYSTPPTVSVTAPTSPQSIPRPIVKWNYADVDGEAQYGWIAQIVKQSVYSAAGYDPNNFTGQTWGFSGTGTATQATPDVDLPNYTTYRAYVKLSSSPNPSGGLQYSSYAFTEFDLRVPPYASSITYPANGAVVDLQAGFNLTWQNSFYGSGSSQAAFSIRRLDSGSTAATGYTWWNGSIWQSAEYFLSGTSPSYAFRANEVLNGVSYTFAVAIRDGYGGQSPYSSGVTVTGSTAAQVTVTQPSKTVVITNPTISWSVYDAENDPQQSYQIRIIERNVFQGISFDPGTSPAVWDSTEVVNGPTRDVVVPVSLTNAFTYRAYVRVKTTGVYSGWAYTEFVVSLLPPAVPTATVEVLPDEATAFILIQGRDSMLDDQTGRAFGGWQTLANSTVTGAQSYPSAYSGYQMRFESAAAGDFSIQTSTIYPVLAGMQYTAAASLIKTGTVAALNGRVSIEFFNASSVSIGLVDGSLVSDNTAAQSWLTTVAPASATGARMRITMLSAAASGLSHNVFDPVLRPGVGAEWSPGGLLGSTSVSVVEGNDFRILRMGLNIPVPADTQQVSIRDEEITMGTPQSYHVTNRAVYPNATLTAPTLMMDNVQWTSGWLWISDPLRSRTARQFGPQSFDATTRPVRQGVFRPVGRPDAVITTGVRGLREGKFTIVTATKADREAYDALVSQSGIVLLRVPPDQGELDGETIYVKLTGDAPENRLLPSRTPHRGIGQSWIEQRRPLDNLEYSVGS